MSIICAHRNFTVFACDPFSASVTSQKVVVVVVIDTSCGKFCKVEVPFYCAMLLRDAMDSADYAVCHIQRWARPARCNDFNFILVISRPIRYLTGLTL